MSKFMQENAAVFSRYTKFSFIPANQSLRALFWLMKPNRLAYQDVASAPEMPELEEVLVSVWKQA